MTNRLVNDAGSAFAAARDGFRAALAAPGARLVERRHEIAGRVVVTRVLGRGLAEWLLPPLAHLEVEANGDAAGPELVVELSSGTGAPGGAPGNGEGVACSPDGRFVVHRSASAVVCLDRVEGRIVGSVPDPRALPSWERAKPLSLPLTVWCTDLGGTVLHAGLVARGDRGVLLCGPSGAGKSAGALACLAAGFDFLGDDCVVVHRDADTFVGSSLYSVAALDPRLIDRIGLPGNRSELPGAASRGKSLLWLEAYCKDRLRPRVPVAAVVIPRFSGVPRCRVRAVSKGEALRTIAPSSIVRRAIPGDRNLRALARLVAELPCFSIDTGSDPLEVPPRIDAILAGLPPLECARGVK